MKLMTLIPIQLISTAVRNNLSVAFVDKTPLQHIVSSLAMSTQSRFSETSNDDMMIDKSVVPPLRYIGDKGLMKKQPPVNKEIINSDNFQEQLGMLHQAMKKYGGIGIAAPQIGWWTRVFCFGIDGTNPRYPAASSVPFAYWINPEIIWTSETTNYMWEGCLSVPGMRGWVERPSEIILRGMDEKGNIRESRLSGLKARVAQHEFDHLDGILFPMCVPSSAFLLPHASMDVKDDWDEDWPSRGSRMTGLGELSDER